MFVFNYETEIIIENIPLPWIPKIELYYPDLPQFPIIYIHTHICEKRIIACPVAVSYDINEYSSNAKFNVLINVQPTETVKSKIVSELAERIGYSQKITKDDVIACCNQNEDYIALFEDLWGYIKASYGESIPYGKYYEEVFSIVRFVSAWQPKTGRQSEMRILYNFMSAFGEMVQMPDRWSHLEFYVIPNLNDVYRSSFSEFSNFFILQSTMVKLFKKYFTETVVISDVEFSAMKRAWKQNKDDFISEVTNPMFTDGILSEEEKLYAEMLVDAFNRHA